MTSQANRGEGRKKVIFDCNDDVMIMTDDLRGSTAVHRFHQKFMVKVWDKTALITILTQSD